MTLETLYRDYYQQFIYKIYPYLHSYDVAEEVVQEAFAKAMIKINTYNPNKGGIKNWFHSILFNTMWAYKRAVKKTLPSNGSDELEQVLQNDPPDYEALFSSVKNDFHRKILITYFMMGYSYKEVSEVMGVGRYNVRKIIQRFKKGFVL